MASIRKPNSLCKNINCKRPFFASAFCVRQRSWKSVACSPICFKAYTDQVAEARGGVNRLPERIDMTNTQIEELMVKPIEEVKEIARVELGDYVEELEEVGLDKIVDKINEEIKTEEAKIFEVEELKVRPKSKPKSNAAQKRTPKTKEIVNKVEGIKVYGESDFSNR